MKITLICQTQIDWPSYLIATKSLNVNGILDSKKIPITNPLAFLITLSDLKGLSYNLNNLGSLLQHCFYGFLIETTERKMYEIIKESHLHITTESGNEIGVATGNLAEWHLAIINGCSDTADSEYRRFINQVLLIFEANGLGQLWSNYQKIKLQDLSFSLIQKP
jgi:hypothetical protein